MGLLPVTAFASLLGIATILHWDRFNHSHISFITWAALYFTTPFIVFAVWLRNRAVGSPISPGERIIPSAVRIVIGVVGATTLAISLLLFLVPSVAIAAWPWMLTPLTARVVGAMFALPGVVGIAMALEPRWSAAKIILESQVLSIAVILVAAARAAADFDGSPTAWFVGGLSALAAFILVLYVAMDRRG